MHVVRQAVATARNVHPVRGVIVAAVAAQLMKKGRNAVAVLPLRAKRKLNDLTPSARKGAFHWTFIIARVQNSAKHRIRDKYLLGSQTQSLLTDRGLTSLTVFGRSLMGRVESRNRPCLIWLCFAFESFSLQHWHQWQ
jgi:hypothetical protein